MKKRMKKVFSYLFATLFAIAFVVACGNLDTLEEPGQNKSALGMGEIYPDCLANNCAMEGKIPPNQDGVCLDGALVTPKTYVEQYYTHKYVNCPDPKADASTAGAGGTATGGAGGSAGAPSTCIPGQQATCTDCTGGLVGYHVCKSDGTYDVCVCPTPGTGGSGTGGSGGSVSGCIPGQQVACGCLGGDQGFQVCNANGTYDACQCPDAGTGGTSTGGSGGSVSGCIQGQQIECGCLGGTKGFQICSDAGTYDTCQCPTPGTGGSGGSVPPINCVPGTQIGCGCLGGAQGVQVCAADGMSYLTCQCPTPGTGGSGGSIPPTNCTPGNQIPCACMGGVPGFQVCAPDGMSYLACQCAEAGAAGSGGAGGSGGTAGTGGSGGSTSTLCHEGESCAAYNLKECDTCSYTSGTPPVAHDFRCEQGIMVVVGGYKQCGDAGTAGSGGTSTGGSGGTATGGSGGTATGGSGGTATGGSAGTAGAAGSGTVADLCTQNGVAGKMTVVIKTGDAPAAGQVLAVYGKVDFDNPSTSDLPYSVWQFAAAGQTVVVATPVDVQTGLSVFFAWGFTNTGNSNYNSWNLRCSPSTCNVKDQAAWCSGTTFLGAFDKGTFVPPAPNNTCDYHLNGNGSEEITCKK